MDNTAQEDTVKREVARETIAETLRRVADHLDKAQVNESNIDLFKFMQMDEDGYRTFELILECIVKPTHKCDWVVDRYYTEDRNLYMK